MTAIRKLEAVGGPHDGKPFEVLEGVDTVHVRDCYEVPIFAADSNKIVGFRLVPTERIHRYVVRDDGRIHYDGYFE